MVIVISIHLQEEVILTCCIVAFNHLWNLTECLNDIIKLLWILQIQTYERTSFLSNTLWINDKFGAFQYSKVR